MTVVHSSTEARKNLAALVSAAQAGEEVLIGPGGVAAVRITSASTATPASIPPHELTVLLHGRAQADARFAMDYLERSGMFLIPTASGDVIEMLASFENPWWLEEYVRTLITAARQIAAAGGSPAPTLKTVLMAAAMATRSVDELAPRFLGQVQESVAAWTAP